MLRGILSVATLLVASVSMAQFDISGTVTYRERIALPATATLIVSLELLSAGPKPEVISEARYRTGGRQVPLDFHILFRPECLHPGSALQLLARIEDRGRVLFATELGAPVVAGQKVNLVLTQPSGLIGQQLVVAAVDGKPVPTGLKAPWIEFSRDGRMGGNTGVNSFGGQFTMTGDRLKITPGPMTMMAGSPEAMRQEQAFMAALARVTGFRKTANGLELLSGDQVVVALRPGKP